MKVKRPYPVSEYTWKVNVHFGLIEGKGAVMILMVFSFKADITLRGKRKWGQNGVVESNLRAHLRFIEQKKNMWGSHGAHLGSLRQIGNLRGWFDETFSELVRATMKLIELTDSSLRMNEAVLTFYGAWEPLTMYTSFLELIVAHIGSFWDLFSLIKAYRASTHTTTKAYWGSSWLILGFIIVYQRLTDSKII